MYSNNDRRQLENVVVRNMILKDKRFDRIKDKIHIDLYNRLINRKKRVIEEDHKIRINLIKNFYIINNDEDVQVILKGIAPLIINKKRSILVMVTIMRR